MTRPTDNLLRAVPPAVRASTITEEGDGRTLHGYFSVFDTWYEIDSVYEGRFLERVAPGAFLDTLEDPSRIKVLYDHGMDPSIGNKPLGPIRSVGEDDTGAFYEVRLSDTSYNRDIKELLGDGLLGSSFRFAVRDEQWHDPARAADHNPEKLPERTITRADVFEFGPVTFPASETAPAGIRSMTDTFADRLLNDPKFLAQMTERVGLNNATRMIDQLAPDGPSTETPDDAAAGSTPGTPKSIRAARAAMHPSFKKGQPNG